MAESSIDATKKHIDKDVKDIGNSFDTESKKIIDSLKSIASAAGLAFGVSEIIDFTKKVIEMRSYFQDIESSMKVFLGNAEEGAKFTKQLKDYAYYNMFEFKDLAQASQQMIAYGHETDEIIKRLDQLSNVATGTHAPLMELVAAYNRAKSTGVVDANGLQSWAVKGVMIKDVLKDLGEQAVGTTITFSQLNKVLDSVTGEGGQFHNLMGEMMNNISAEIGQFEDSFASMLNEIGEKYQDQIVGGIKYASELVDSYQQIAAVIQDLIVAYGIYKAALIVANTLEKGRVAGLYKLTAAEQLHYGALVLEEKAQAALNATILKNPYVLAAMAVGALAFGIYKLATATSTAEKANQDLENTLENLNEQQKEYNKQTEDAISLAQSDSTATEDRKEAMDLLISRYPDIIEKYIDEKGQLRDILKLKKEIAAYDGKMQREEKTNNLKLSRDESKALYEELKAIEGREGVSLSITKEQREADKRRKLEIQRIFKEQTGGGGVFGTATTGQMLKYFQQKSIQSDQLYRRSLTENKLTDFTAEGGALGEYSDEQLKALQKHLRDANKKGNENKSVFISELQDYLTYNDRESLLKRVNGMLSARTNVVGAEKTYKALKDNFEKQKTTFNSIKKNMDDGVETYVKKVDDSWEIVSKGTKGAVLATQEHFEEIKKSAKAAESAYQSIGGDTKKKKDDTPKKLAQQKQEEWKRAEEMAKLAREAEDAEADALVAGIRNEGEREREARDIEHKRKLRDINLQQEEVYKTIYEQRKKQWELTHKNSPYELTDEGGKGWQGLKVLNKWTEEEQKLIDEKRKYVIAQTEKENKEYAKLIEDRYDDERKAILAFLQEYGTYEQRRAAITESFEKQIKRASTIGEKLTLNRQKESALKQLDVEEFKNSIHWEDVFQTIDNLSEEYLIRLRSKIKEYLAKSGKDISIQDVKIFTDKINDINDAIQKRKGAWKQLFGLATPELDKQEQLERKIAEANERVLEAKEKQVKAATDLLRIQNQISINTGISSKDINTGNAEQISTSLSKKGYSQDQITEYLKNLSNAENSMQQASEGMEQASGALEGLQGMGGGGNWGAEFQETLSFVAKICESIDKNVQSMSTALEDLGLEDTRFGKGWSDFAESSTYAVNGIHSLQEGDVVGVGVAVLGSLRTLGTAIGKWAEGNPLFGDSDWNLEEDLEKLTASNQALKYSIDELKDKMDDASLSESFDVKKQILDNYRQAEANTREMMQRSADAWSNGFLGIGGSHSSHYKVNEAISKAEWERVSALVNKTITTSQQFFNLTSEEMYKVARDLPDIYAHIKAYADEGYEDAAQYMDEYIEYWKSAKEIEDQFVEKLTSTNLDSLVDDFASALMDMDSEAEDFSENFEKYMQKAIINSFVSNTYKKELDKWLKNFQKAMENDGKIDVKEEAALRAEYEDIANRALAERDELRKVLGWDEASYRQSASGRSFQTMSQETGDELSGRFTALQISGEDINATAKVILQNITTMSTLITSSTASLSALQTMAAERNIYLNEISTAIRIIKEDFGKQLAEVVDNTKYL